MGSIMTQNISRQLSSIVPCNACMQLTDQLDTYIPSFANMRVLLSKKQAKVKENRKHAEHDPIVDVYTVPAERPITIKHLLTHTSGFACSSFIAIHVAVICTGNRHRRRNNKQTVKITRIPFREQCRHTS